MDKYKAVVSEIYLTGGWTLLAESVRVGTIAVSVMDREAVM